MSKRRKGYKYNSDKDIVDDLFVSFYDYFEPFFNSFKTSPKTFIIQIANLALVLTFLNLTLGQFYAKIIGHLSGSATIGMQLFLIVLSVVAVSALKKNSVLRWQTLFDTGYAITVKYLKRLIVINIVSYGLNYIYEQRHQK